MFRKLYLLLGLTVVLSGCTREVYLQAVPCVEGECKPCPIAAAPCPELEMLQERTVYQVYDVPSEPVVYQPVCQSAPVKTCTKTVTHKKTCRKVCREVLVD